MGTHGRNRLGSPAVRQHCGGDPTTSSVPGPDRACCDRRGFSLASAPCPIEPSLGRDGFLRILRSRRSDRRPNLHRCSIGRAVLVHAFNPSAPRLGQTRGGASHRAEQRLQKVISASQADQVVSDKIVTPGDPIERSSRSADGSAIPQVPVRLSAWLRARPGHAETHYRPACRPDRTKRLPV